MVKKTRRGHSFEGDTLYGENNSVTEAQFSSVSFNKSPLSRRFSSFIFRVTPPVEYRMSRERSERGQKKPDEGSHASKPCNQVIPH